MVLQTAAGEVGIPCQDWDPGEGAAALVLPLSEKLERSGFRALLEAAGADDAWTFDLSSSRKAFTGRIISPEGGDGQKDLVRAGQLFGAVVVAALVLLAVMSVTGYGTTWLAAAAPAAVLVAGLIATVRAELLLRRARQRLEAPVASDLKVTGLPSPVQLATVDGGLVIVTPYADERHLPGPLDGGVVSAEVLEQQGPGVREVRLHLARHTGGVHPVPVLTLKASWWQDDIAVGERVVEWLRLSGIQIGTHTVPRNAPLPKNELWADVRRYAVLWPGEGMRLMTLVAVFSAAAGALLTGFTWPVFAPAVLAAVPVLARLRWWLHERRDRRA